jgi:hypothetical protein
LLIDPLTNGGWGVTVQEIFEIGIEGLKSPAARLVNLQLFVPLFRTLIVTLTVLFAARCGVRSGSASENEMEEGLTVKVRVCEKAVWISKDRKKAIEKMKMKRNFLIPAVQKDHPEYTVFFIKLQQKE